MWLVKNRIIGHLEKCGLFSDFQYGFRSSWSIADLLTVVSDRIARISNRSEAIQAVVLDISKTLAQGLACWSSSQPYGSQNFDFNIWPYFVYSQKKRWLCVLLDGQYSQEYPVIEFLRAPFLFLQFFYYTLMTFLMMLSVIFLSMLMTLLSLGSVTRHLIGRKSTRNGF